MPPLNLTQCIKMYQAFWILLASASLSAPTWCAFQFLSQHHTQTVPDRMANDLSCISAYTTARFVNLERLPWRFHVSPGNLGHRMSLGFPRNKDSFVAEERASAAASFRNKKWKGRCYSFNCPPLWVVLPVIGCPCHVFSRRVVVLWDHWQFGCKSWIWLSRKATRGKLQLSAQMRINQNQKPLIKDLVKDDHWSASKVVRKSFAKASRK